ncbi:MAG: hypothetical protein ACK5GV_08750 [Bacteroidota bacterium]
MTANNVAAEPNIVYDGSFSITISWFPATVRVATVAPEFCIVTNPAVAELFKIRTKFAAPMSEPGEVVVSATCAANGLIIIKVSD